MVEVIHKNAKLVHQFIKDRTRNSLRPRGQPWQETVGKQPKNYKVNLVKLKKTGKLAQKQGNLKNAETVETGKHGQKQW